MKTLHLSSGDYFVLKTALTNAALSYKKAALQAEADVKEAPSIVEKEIFKDSASRHWKYLSQVEELANKIGVRFPWQTQVI